MDSLNIYTEASLELASAEQELKKDIEKMLGISEHKIKSISLKNCTMNNVIHQSIIVELTGKNRIKSGDISQIKGLTVVTPNKLVFDVGEIHL